MSLIFDSLTYLFSVPRAVKVTDYDIVFDADFGMLKDGSIVLKLIVKHSTIVSATEITENSNFTSMWLKYVSIFYREILDFQCSTENILCYITDTDIGSIKSLHTNTLFDKYLDHMLLKFEQTRMVWNIQNFELFGKKKIVYIFLESVHAIFVDVPVT